MTTETTPVGAGESSPAPDGSASLEARMEAAIEARRFNFLEIRGFQTKPRLALIAGAAIGYALAIEDFQKQNKLILKEFDHARSEGLT